MIPLQSYAKELLSHQPDLYLRRMEGVLLFQEEQKFKQWWIWALLLGLDALFVTALVQQIGMGKPFGSNPSTDLFLIVVSISIFLITILFVFMKLETQIRTDGVYVRFIPFHRSYKFFAWTDIQHAEVRKYSAIKEYGGWGLRNGALNVSGNMGLQLNFTNGRKLLIGTQKPDELSLALSKNHPSRR